MPSQKQIAELELTAAAAGAWYWDKNHNGGKYTKPIKSALKDIRRARGKVFGGSPEQQIQTQEARLRLEASIQAASDKLVKAYNDFAANYDLPNSAKLAEIDMRPGAGNVRSSATIIQDALKGIGRAASENLPMPSLAAVKERAAAATNALSQVAWKPSLATNSNAPTITSNPYDTPISTSGKSSITKNLATKVKGVFPGSSNGAAVASDVLNVVDRNGMGWKLHLSVGWNTLENGSSEDAVGALTRAQNVDNYLQKLKAQGKIYDYKFDFDRVYGKGKDFTVYFGNGDIGSRDSAKAVAKLIEDNVGKDLMAQQGAVLTTDGPVNGSQKIWGRFDIGSDQIAGKIIEGDPRFRFYGEEGIPILKEAPDLATLSPSERASWIRRSYDVLKQDYGDVFTGKAGDVSGVRAINPEVLASAEASRAANTNGGSAAAASSTNTRSSYSNLRDVGANKPMGYDGAGDNPKAIVDELKGRGLKVITVSGNNSYINRLNIRQGEFIYAYDENALQKLLDSNRQTLKEAGWPTDAKKFVKRVAGDGTTLEKTPVYDVIADAFGDKSNYGRTDVTTVTAKGIADGLESDLATEEKAFANAKSNGTLTRTEEKTFTRRINSIKDKVTRLRALDTDVIVAGEGAATGSSNGAVILDPKTGRPVVEEISSKKPIIVERGTKVFEEPSSSAVEPIEKVPTSRPVVLDPVTGRPIVELPVEPKPIEVVTGNRPKVSTTPFETPEVVTSDTPPRVSRIGETPTKRPGTVIEPPRGTEISPTGGRGTVLESPKNRPVSPTGGRGTVIESPKGAEISPTGGRGTVLEPPKNRPISPTGGRGTILEPKGARATVIEPPRGTAVSPTGGRGTLLDPVTGKPQSSLSSSVARSAAADSVEAGRIASGLGKAVKIGGAAAGAAVVTYTAVDATRRITKGDYGGAAADVGTLGAIGALTKIAGGGPATIATALVFGAVGGDSAQNKVVKMPNMEIVTYPGRGHKGESTIITSKSELSSKDLAGYTVVSTGKDGTTYYKSADGKTNIVAHSQPADAHFVSADTKNGLMLYKNKDGSYKLYNTKDGKTTQLSSGAGSEMQQEFNQAAAAQAAAHPTTYTPAKGDQVIGHVGISTKNGGVVDARLVKKPNGDVVTVGAKGTIYHTDRSQGSAHYTPTAGDKQIGSAPLKTKSGVTINQRIIQRKNGDTVVVGANNTIYHTSHGAMATRTTPTSAPAKPVPRGSTQVGTMTGKDGNKYPVYHDPKTGATYRTNAAGTKIFQTLSAPKPTPASATAHPTGPKVGAIEIVSGTKKVTVPAASTGKLGPHPTGLPGVWRQEGDHWVRESATAFNHKDPNTGKMVNSKMRFQTYYPPKPAATGGTSTVAVPVQLHYNGKTWVRSDGSAATASEVAQANAKYSAAHPSSGGTSNNGSSATQASQSHGGSSASSSGGSSTTTTKKAPNITKTTGGPPPTGVKGGVDYTSINHDTGVKTVHMDDGRVYTVNAEGKAYRASGPTGAAAATTKPNYQPVTTLSAKDRANASQAGLRTENIVGKASLKNGDTVYVTKTGRKIQVNSKTHDTQVVGEDPGLAKKFAESSASANAKPAATINEDPATGNSNTNLITTESGNQRVQTKVSYAAQSGSTYTVGYNPDNVVSSRALKNGGVLQTMKDGSQIEVTPTGGIYRTKKADTTTAGTNGGNAGSSGAATPTGSDVTTAAVKTWDKNADTSKTGVSDVDTHGTVLASRDGLNGNKILQMSDGKYVSVHPDGTVVGAGYWGDGQGGGQSVAGIGNPAPGGDGGTGGTSTETTTTSVETASTAATSNSSVEQVPRKEPIDYGRTMVNDAGAKPFDKGVTTSLTDPTTAATSNTTVTAASNEDPSGMGVLVGGAQAAACFPAGSSVLTPDGHNPIEDIKLGDMVMTWNFDSKSLEPTQVIDVLAHADRATIIIKTNLGEVVSTPEHPFWDGKRWLAADKLTDGKSKIMDQLGHLHVVESITKGPRAAVYNFHVTNPEHNYFVNGFLVHNRKITD